MSVGPYSTHPHVDCTVIVVTYNSERHIGEFLQSIVDAAQRCTWRAVVVDNGSADGTRERVADFGHATWVDAGRNGGYAAGINIGRERAGPCRSVLIANPDLLLAPGSIDALFGALQDNTVGVAVPLLIDAQGRPTRSLRREPTIGRQLGEAVLGDHLARRPGWSAEIIRDQQAYRTRHRVDWACGAILMVSERCNEAVGRWDERYFLYSEEIDFARRVRAAGFAIIVDPSASAVHHAGGSGRSGWLLELLGINRIRYFRAHHGRVRSLFYASAVLLQFVLRSKDPWQRRAALTVARVSVPAVTWNRFPDPETLAAGDARRTKAGYAGDRRAIVRATTRRGQGSQP